MKNIKKYKNNYINSALFISSIYFLRAMTQNIDEIKKLNDLNESTSSETLKKNINLLLSATSFGFFIKKVYF